MLYKLEATNNQGNTLALPLEDVSNGLYIADIDGMGPVKATLVSTSFARLDGQQYHSSRRDARNITIKIDLEPDWATESVYNLRKRAYAYFMPKSWVKLRFYMDEGLTVDIEGRVESCEATIFSNKPMLDISIMCFDPDFLALTSTTVTGNTTSSTTETTINYPGEVEAGFNFQLSLNRTLSQFTIYNTTPDGEIRSLDFAASLLNADVVKISTVVGNKEATLTRSGSQSSILYGVSPQSAWLELVPGVNKIRVYATGAAIPWSISYKSRYGGL